MPHCNPGAPVRRGVLALMAFALLAAAGCRACGPVVGNFAFVGFRDVPSGQTATLTSPMPGGAQTVDFIGRIYYPSYDTSVLEDGTNPGFEGIAVAPGSHPLIVFGHGRFGPGVPYNYVGMTHLLHHLASWGYICISVNLDVVHGLQAAHQHGIPHRGELFLRAVDFMLQQNADAGSRFFGKVDPGRIALVGHARGGGGAIAAANQNLAAGSPRSLRGIATISPVDFSVQPLQAPVPHLSLYGTWDGDLFDGQGPRIWDGGVRTAARQHVEIYGANHFHFTDSITFSGESHGIAREDHHEVAQGFINAFFDVHVRDNARWEWPLYLTGERNLRPGVHAFLQLLSPDFRSIDDGSPLGSAATNSLGGENESSSLALFTDAMLTESADHFYNQSAGLLVHWNDPGDRLAFAFAPEDASPFTHLHFRVSQRPVDPADATDPLHAFNTVNTRKDWRVRLSDASGGMAAVSIAAYQGGLQYPDQSGSLPVVSPFQFKSIPRSYRIPLTDFEGVDRRRVREVAFIFDRPDGDAFANGTGAIAVDDVEFAR